MALPTSSTQQDSMWLLDSKRSAKVESAQLYLTVIEARRMRDALIKLIGDPEAIETEQIGEANELSVAIVTDRKLDAATWTLRQRQLLFDNQ
jgi:hypothetical protein